MRAGHARVGRRVAARVGVGIGFVVIGVVAAVAPAAAVPAVVAPSRRAAGQNIAISGSGWPGFTSVSVYLKQGAPQTFMCTLGSDASGDLPPSACALPANLPAGAYTLFLTDGASASASQAFTLNPSIKV